tara:strand:+ start:318 stop:1181 length:864 start_codon:yes stop_codon:yes gene_type:complete
MKIYIIYTVFTLLFSDSLEVKSIFDTGFKMKSEIKLDFNKELPPELSPLQIDLIKSKAKDFIPLPVTENDIITMETNFGTMEFVFYNEDAPKHSYNFKKLANSGFYDETIFHRIIPGFMAQGGDILTRDLNKNNDGTGNPGWTINEEFNNINHERGILSMARSQDINSAGSQFFICFGNAPHLNNKYTVFGKLISGYEVLDKIENLKSESDYIIHLSIDKIPANSEYKFLEYNYKNKKKFIRIPKHQNEEEYKKEVFNQLKNNHRTKKPVKIIKVRVRDENIEKHSN